MIWPKIKSHFSKSLTKPINKNYCRENAVFKTKKTEAKDELFQLKQK